MLVNQGVRNGGGPGRFLGSAVAASTEAGKWATPGALRNQFAGEARVTTNAVTAKAGIPWGYRHPGAWVLPQKAGALSTAGRLSGLADLTGSGAGGKAAEATLAGTGDLTGTGALIVSAVATLTGSGEIDDAAAVAYLNAAATLAGSGDLEAAADALGWALAVLAGTSTLDDTLTATGTMEAEITPFTDLSPQSLAAAVWDSDEGRFLYAVAHHRVVTDPAAGTYTVYDDDDVTPLYVADLWENAAGTAPYAGSGAERRDRFS